MWLDRSLEWRESVVFTAGLFSRKSVERLEIMNGIRRVTKSFELVRADLHLVDGLALTSTSGYSLGVPKGPYVEAVGQVLVEDSFEGVVMFRRNHSHKENCHGSIPCVGWHRLEYRGGAWALAFHERRPHLKLTFNR